MYRKFVPFCGNRRDLTYLIGEMIGELSTSHAYVGGGDLPQVQRIDIGLLGVMLKDFGYNYVNDPIDAWGTLILMDVWHWTPLVALLCYAGLRAIPDAYYQAASIDGASKFAVFRYIQLPKLRGVLMIAVLLRFMDSFMIYTEPFVVTGGGPGNATTFLSIDLVKMAVGQFDLGPAAAFSIMYFLVILLVSWVFYTVMTNLDKEEAR